MAVKLKDASPATVEYNALRGSYGRVTYFVTKSSLRDVAENLDLAPQEELSFSERIQRIINEERVQNEILPYLEENELRFFNALVCILMPDEDSNQPFWGFDEYADNDGNLLGGLGKLRIAKKVARVVLDGQHRFRALRSLWDQVKKNPTCRDASIEVALIFVVVDDIGQFGTRRRKVRTKTIEAVRNLFAVLNKTARRVDNTTLLLIDDTDIANVMTRKMIEDGLINESLVKWTGGQNLQPRDPYFTVIHVIRDAICFYLRDFEDMLQNDYGMEKERRQALADYYENTPRVEVPVKRAIPEIVNSMVAMAKWTALLKKFKIEIAQQPDTTVLAKNQSKALKEEREKQLGFTVAGQKVLFRGTIEAFCDQNRRNLTNLRMIIARANRAFERNLLARQTQSENPYFDILFDARGRMAWAEYAVEMSRRIFGKALGSNSDAPSILEDYRDLTDHDPSIVEEYWRKVKGAWPK